MQLVRGQANIPLDSDSILILFQSGNLRTPKETVNEIKNQLANAKLSGAAEKVRTSLSTTGVRDSLSLGILTTLVEMGKKLRKRDAGVPAMKESEVKATLEKELEDLLNGKSLDDVINPLLGMKGKAAFYFFS